jgi:hypothetical protein
VVALVAGGDAPGAEAGCDDEAVRAFEVVHDLVPTDLICYLAGVTRMPIAVLLLGVGIGEGAICAVYIFVGDSLLQAFGWR